MPRSRAGFSLLEVMTALVILVLCSILALRTAISTTQAVAIGQRWADMAFAAEGELIRLEREYRRGRPVCLVPAAGSRYTADGIGLDWWVSGDSALLSVAIEARAAAGGRRLADSVFTRVSCR